MDSRCKKKKKNQHHQQKSTLMPMLCRASSKDVRLSHHKLDGSILSFPREPSSPKVSCIGQLVYNNNNNNNKVISFATPYKHNTTTTTPSSRTRSSTNNSNNKINHSHPKHTSTNNLLVMIKNAMTIIAGSNAANNNSRSGNVINVNACHGRSCTSTRNRCIIKRRKGVISATEKPSESAGFVEEVNIIGELDPPLPVIKKVRQHRGAQPGCDEVNLWRRRSCRAPLKALEIDHIQFTSSQQFCSSRRSCVSLYMSLGDH